MRPLSIISLLLVTFFGCLGIMACKKQNLLNNYSLTPLNFKNPAGWPGPQYNFDSNRLTKESFELGRKLFYDGKLSIDGTVSCANCHQQYAVFTTFDHDLSHGINNTHTTRNASSLTNLAWRKNFLWDAGTNQLEEVTLAHITSPTEMGESLTGVINKLKSDATYRQLFKTAFEDDIINSQRMSKAISQFVLMMVSSNSKYDKVMRGETSFNTPESLGYTIFKAKCSSCHAEPLFTDNSFRNIGMPEDIHLKDKGRMRITNNPGDSLKFRVPSLRNIEWTAPYGHDGSFINLDLVMEHYRSKVVDGPTTDPLVKNKIPISNFEIGQLKAFLYTLTDTAFINDRRFLNP